MGNDGAFIYSDPSVYVDGREVEAGITITDDEIIMVFNEEISNNSTLLISFGGEFTPSDIATASDVLTISSNSESLLKSVQTTYDLSFFLHQ